MKVDDMFPRNYLSGEDLPQPVTVTVADIETTEFYRPGEGKVRGYLLVVKNGHKKVILSQTLARQLAGIFGSGETEQWIGKVCVLFAVEMNVAGEKRWSIRARAA